MIKPVPRILAKHITGIQKFIIITMGIIVAVTTPFFMYVSWVSSINDLSDKPDISEETQYFINNYMISHMGLTGLTVFSILLLLLMFYFLISKNEKLQKSQILISESEENQRMITENITDLISKHALDGKYKYLSPSSKTILVYEPEELIGQTPAVILHPDSIDKAL